MNQLADTSKPTEPGSSTDALASVHTQSFWELLKHLKCSIVVSTYQAGRLVFLRADDSAVNTHFRLFQRPMGIAEHGGRLWVGTAHEVLEFHNSPTVAASVEPLGVHDACYLPRNIHVTGDIQIHEMAVAQSQLWIVNTRFSCLCQLDNIHSFVPRWRPSFITELAPEDRCHLNGLAIKDDRPAFVTALGKTNVARGWRENKRDGGMILSVPDSEPVIERLSMPHSPRWHQGNLWVLESGTGSLGIIDVAGGKYEPIVHLPGFTRGLDFIGSYAIVGLSQVRESATFSGLPITEKEERSSGVWIVDIESAAVVAFLRFDGSVQEIFAVQALSNVRYPELVIEGMPEMADAFILP